VIDLENGWESLPGLEDRLTFDDTVGQLDVPGRADPPPLEIDRLPAIDLVREDLLLIRRRESALARTELGGEAAELEVEAIVTSAADVRDSVGFIREPLTPGDEVLGDPRGFEHWSDELIYPMRI